MLSRQALVLIFVGIAQITAEKCLIAEQRRSRVQYYFDPKEWTCFAIPADCTPSLKIDFKLYDNEEECTLVNMVRLWKSYSLSCAPGHRLATYQRSNGDQVPYIFSSALCRGSQGSEICEADEVCHTHGGFGYCCKESAFEGNGPNSGTFNFTGLGGKNFIMTKRMITTAPLPPPKDCNLDGKRGEVEWFPLQGMACLSRRKSCNSPGFRKLAQEKTYDSQQACMDAHFPNLKMTYKLTCMPGYTAATEKDVALIFAKDQCGSLYHSDVCNRDEYCAYRNGSPYAFCCTRNVIQYAVSGKGYFGRKKRQVILL